MGDGTPHTADCAQNVRSVVKWVLRELIDISMSVIHTRPSWRAHEVWCCIDTNRFWDSSRIYMKYQIPKVWTMRVFNWESCKRICQADWSISLWHDLPGERIYSYRFTSFSLIGKDCKPFISYIWNKRNRSSRKRRLGCIENIDHIYASSLSHSYHSWV